MKTVEMVVLLLIRRRCAAGRPREFILPVHAPCPPNAASVRAVRRCFSAFIFRVRQHDHAKYRDSVAYVTRSSARQPGLLRADAKKLRWHV